MDAGALEFWIGAWHCSWSGGHGTNSITRELDDRVVVERFKAEGPEPFHGMSISVFDEPVGWRQTWVDSNGSYWHFEGSTLDDGSPVFATPEPVDVERAYKRMVFSNITAQGFEWRWESSPDGDRWHERWSIAYSRIAWGDGLLESNRAACRVRASG